MPPRLPMWMRRSLPPAAEGRRIRRLLGRLELHTVCEEARCPNRAACWHEGAAAFLILGDACTRDCRFCAIPHDPRPAPPDPAEPARLADAAAALGLRHVVVTSVTRDDLPDGGAGHFAATIAAVRRALPRAIIEVLIPDFQGRAADLAAVLAAGPDILNHNVETVPELYPRIRPQADFEQSLTLLRRAKEAGFITKSGLMVGLGEDDAAVHGVLDALAEIDCRIVTVGQYMRPSRKHPPVQRYVHPDVFASYARYGAKQGIAYVFSAPLVRSSYNAKDVFEALRRTEAEKAG